MYPIRLHNNQKLHRYLLIFLWVYAGATLISVVLNYYTTQRMVGADFMNPNYAREQMPQILITGVIGFFIGMLSMVFPILFIVWFYRAYDNLGKVNRQLTSLSLGWSIGAWFVPVLNFIWPFRIMKEIWNGTQSAARQPGEAYNQEPPRLISFWWGCLLLAITVAMIGAFMSMQNMLSRMLSVRNPQRMIENTQSIMREAMERAFTIQIATTFLYLVALFILYLVLKKLAPMEESLADRVARSGYGQWPTMPPPAPGNPQAPYTY